MAISHVDVPVGPARCPALTLTAPLWSASHGAEAHKEAAPCSPVRGERRRKRHSRAAQPKQWHGAVNAPRPRAVSPPASSTGRDV